MSPSSQGSGVPATQSPLTQVSSPSQTLLLAQSTSPWQQPLIDVLTQPVNGLHVSYVQRAPSLQFGGAVSWQPAVGSQVSAPSHALPSSQLSDVPATQLPDTHV